MPYININEVDKTIAQNQSTKYNDIVFVPVNSSDGPSDFNVLVTSYDQFVQKFGMDTHPESVLMTSWSYAANLLLRKMPVLVRRITHELLDDGSNSNKMLPGVNSASAAHKIPDATNASKYVYAETNKAINPSSSYEFKERDVFNSKSWNIIGTAPNASNNISCNLIVRSLDADTEDTNIESSIPTDFLFASGNYKVETQGSIKIVNTDEAKTGRSVYVSCFYVPGEAKDYETRFEIVSEDHNTIAIDRVAGLSVFNAAVYNSKGQDVSDSVIIKKINEEYAIELKPGYSIIPRVDNASFAKISTNGSAGCTIQVVTNNYNGGYIDMSAVSADKFDPALSYEVSQIVAYCGGIYECIEKVMGPTILQEADGRDLQEASGRFLSTSDAGANPFDPSYWTHIGNVFEAFGHRYKTSGAVDDLNNLPEYDGDGNINFFKLKYKFPGTNGNRMSVSLKTVVGDGIFLQVWNNDQRVENIYLVNFRYKTKEGYWAYYDIFADIEKIWSMLLENFGINYSRDIQQGSVEDWNIEKSYSVGAQVRYNNRVYRCRQSCYSGESFDPIKWNDVTFDTIYTFKQGNIVSTPLETDYLKIEINDNLHPITDNDGSHASYPEYLAALYGVKPTSKTHLYGGSDPSDDDVIHEVSKCYNKLTDKYLYDVYFLTSGAYVDEIIYSNAICSLPTLIRRDIEYSMIDCAEKRGDCIAFADIPFDLDREDVLKYYSHLNTSYATAYAPWVKLVLATGGEKWCPPSFAALYTIAKSINNGNEIYDPPAGVNRGCITEATDLSFEIPSNYIDSWAENYTQFINPIVYIEGYGINIFGQKTLYNKVEESNKESSALQYLNTRLAANTIKKHIFRTCIDLTFEYNNLHTWLSFCNKMSKILDQMKFNHSIVSYSLRMDETTMSDYDIQTNHIVGIVSVVVSTTAEKFDITFQMEPNKVSFVNIDYSQDNVTQ